MRYELLYYELKQKNFNSKKTLDKFLKTLTSDQQLRVIRKEENNYFLMKKTFEGFEE